MSNEHLKLPKRIAERFQTHWVGHWSLLIARAEVFGIEIEWKPESDQAIAYTKDSDNDDFDSEIVETPEEALNSLWDNAQQQIDKYRHIQQRVEWTLLYSPKTIEDTV